jgi:membrane protein DedA with SNARE-associated domain
MVRMQGDVEIATDTGHRHHVATYLVPIALVILVGQVSRAIWPSLLDAAPAALLFMTSTISRLLLVQPLVPAALFFAVAVTRILLLAPLYYFFGRDYGDAALRWGEDKLGASSTAVSKIERGFRKFSHVLVLCWWSPLVCTMAGTTGMRVRIFFPLIAAGAVGRVSLIYFVGGWLAAPLTEISGFISRYAIILTPLTIALTAGQIWYSRRRQRGLPVGSIDDLEADFASTEAELAGEATVTSPRETD